MNSPYEILGVSVDATESEIKQARRRLLFDLHSDRLPKDLPEGAAQLIKERVLEINSAYNQIQKERQRSNAKGGGADASQRHPSNESPQTQQEKNSTKQSGAQVSTSNQGRDGEQSGNPKERIKSGSWVLQIIGAIIGISLMQMCRELRRSTTQTVAYGEKIESIITSTENYCPELKAGIEQQEEQGSDSSLKLLSEMRKSAPEGSKFKIRVEKIIEELKYQDSGNAEELKIKIKSLFADYLPLVCEGELHLAKQRLTIGDRYSEAPPASPETLDLFTNAMCAAMRNNERMDTVDARRAAGAIYMGREIDKIPEQERERVRLEVIQNMGNTQWLLDHGLTAFVKKCPDVAHKIIDN